MDLLVPRLLLIPSPTARPRVASQSNGAETRVAAASPAVSQTAEMTGMSHTLIRCPFGLVMSAGQTCWPTAQKILIRVTAAPHRTAAPQETRTPSFPRDARCGFEEFDPNPQTIADTMRASTLRIRPTVMTAPTMVRICPMPGSPESFGVMSMFSGTRAADASINGEASSNTACSLR